MPASSHAIGVIDKDRGWKAMLKAIEAMAGESYVKVGVLADDAKGGLHAIDPETGKAADLTVAEIAACNEFGTDHIPARPFLRPTFDAVRPELERMSVKGILGILDGRLSVGQVLNLMGAFLAAETKKTITVGAEIAPTNAPSTKARKQAKGKGTVRTLVDTGRMVGAITWTVVQGAFGQGLQ